LRCRRARLRASPDEAVDAAKATRRRFQWVVKAQIHAGGRGKAGGVKLCKTLDEVRAAAKGMLGTQMVTYQSGGRALPVNLRVGHRCHRHRQGTVSVGAG
jgi:succinyl-CoA synthetase beta subunit